jgi:hypothetical protein
MRKSARATCLVLLIAGCLAPRLAHGYEAATTHPGITEQAAYASDLHDWFRSTWELDQGLWERLSLRPKMIPADRRWVFIRDLFRLNPAHGYAPSSKLDNRALHWLMAGSVLEAIPSSRVRHHFLDGRTGKGLREKAGKKGLARKLRLWDYLYGGGTLAGALTGANFDLRGKSALRWAHAKSNHYSLAEHWRHRYQAMVARHGRARLHELTMALVTMGALSQLLQNMGCPSYVRNDFITSHLRQGNILGETPYARYVAEQFGRSGIPKLSGKRVRQRRFDDLFFNSKATGLAQTTARHYFSPGTLPQPVTFEPSKEAQKHLASFEKKWPRPELSPLDWKLQPGQTRYLERSQSSSGFGPIRLAAYGVSPHGELRFWLERRVYRDYASELLPRVVRYTEALIAFLLRGQLELTAVKEGKSEMIAVKNNGVPLASGQLVVLAQNRKGKRASIARKKISSKVENGATLVEIARSTLPADTRAIAAVFKGTDTQKQRLVADGFAPLATSQASPPRKEHKPR